MNEFSLWLDMFTQLTAQEVLIGSGKQDLIEAWSFMEKCVRQLDFLSLNCVKNICNQFSKVWLHNIDTKDGIEVE